jgi:hypothetical protein
LTADDDPMIAASDGHCRRVRDMGFTLTDFREYISIRFFAARPRKASVARRACVRVSDADETLPVKHAEAIDTGDINYKKLKAAAAQGKTVAMEARFAIENHKLEIIIANANGRR